MRADYSLDKCPATAFWSVTASNRAVYNWAVYNWAVYNWAVYNRMEADDWHR
jgi:hypothetical protein